MLVMHRPLTSTEGACASTKPKEEIPMKRFLTACAVTMLMTSPAMAKPLTIGVTLARFDDLFLTKIHDAIQQEAKGMGDVIVQFEDAQNDVARQMNQVQNFISQGVD